jgi:NAD-dependent SIR2 family protein deacetylase
MRHEVMRDLTLGAADVQTASEWLADADRILIAAGAGLSAAAGFDYGDEKRFAELFPALHQVGFRRRYELIGYPLPPGHQWGFWAVHVTDIRFGAEPSPLYGALRDLVGSRSHFVITSNVDQLFARNGFDPAVIFTPQGDYGLAQCLTPCTRDVWPSDQIIAQALEHYDPGTGATSPAGVPACPNCGGPVSINVYAGPWYINDHFEPGRHAAGKWLDQKRDGEKLAVVEIGAGFNTPGVIRWPVERIIEQDPTVRLIRINPDHPEVPAALAARSASIVDGAVDAVARLSPSITNP